MLAGKFLKKYGLGILAVLVMLGFLILYFRRDKRRERNMLLEKKFENQMDKMKKENSESSFDTELDDLVTLIKGETVEKAKKIVGDKYKMRVCFDPKKKINCTMEVKKDRLTLGVDEEGRINHVSIG